MRVAIEFKRILSNKKKMGGPSKKQKQKRKQTRSYLFSSSLEQTVNIQNKAASSLVVAVPLLIIIAIT